MPKRMSLVQHEYAGRRWAAGEVLEVESHHVGLLLSMGRIQREEGDRPDANIWVDHKNMETTRIVAVPASPETRDMAPVVPIENGKRNAGRAGQHLNRRSLT